MDRLEEFIAFARIASTESDLRALQRESRPEPPPQKGKAKTGKRGPARYTYESWTAIAGRSAAENHEVTFRLASKNDLWFHARQRTGAHVILQNGVNAPDSAVEAAGELAAFLSEGRTDTAVDVDVVRVRDVRKLQGGPPGKVTYRNARTLRVRPNAAAWSRAG
jgi:predicted ribosome quality control (RQC) complex YloA/Tae2 family protein